MNGHHHRHHKKEEGNGKYIAGIVISILVIIATISIGVWTITGGFGGPEEKTGQEHASDLEIGTDNGTGTDGSDDAADADGGADSTDDTVAGDDAGTGGSDQDKNAADVQAILDDMTLEEKVCQLFMIKPEALTGVETVTQAGQATQNAYNEYPVGGIIYFSKNLISPEQTRTMLANTQEYAKEQTGIPVFLSVDEEGGQVARVGHNSAFGVEEIGNMSDVGASGDTQEAYRIGTVIGSYLKDLGFNMDAAPDTDVLTNPQNEVVKYRSFGSDPQLVADMAEAELKGLNEEGIIGMYKHFPGHGGTTADSHEGYVYVDDTLEELENSAFVPFKDGIANDIRVIMVSHIAAPNVTGDNTPATLSKKLTTDILREELGFDGMVITDALDMGAITEQYGSANAAVAALNAGVDMLLMPLDFQSAYEGVLDAVADGTLTEERIDESVARILEVKLTM